MNKAEASNAFFMWLLRDTGHQYLRLSMLLEMEFQVH